MDPRPFEARSFPRRGAWSDAAIRAGRAMAPMVGLLQVDVTRARQLLSQRPELSFTAFIAATVGRVAAAQPEVHAYRDWRGRLIVPRCVDVTTLIETHDARGRHALPHLLRDTDQRGVEALSAEIRQVQSAPRSSGTTSMQKRAAFVTRVPGLPALVMRWMARSIRLRALSGTIALSAVGMFTGGGGFALGIPTLMTLSVFVGGIATRPWIVDGAVVPREILDLTLTFDHFVVDGAPAARFAGALRQALEEARVLAGKDAGPSP